MHANNGRAAILECGTLTFPRMLLTQGELVRLPPLENSDVQASPSGNSPASLRPGVCSANEWAAAFLCVWDGSP